MSVGRPAKIEAEDWSDGDFVFINSLCFSDDLLRVIFESAALLKPGSLIATSKLSPNHDRHFSLIKTAALRTSWGMQTIHLLKRK